MIFLPGLRPINPQLFHATRSVSMSARRTLAVLFVCLLIPTGIFAQSSTGAVSGTITDDQGGALPGVTVTATSASTGATRTAISNAAGLYQIALLPPAIYRVEAQLEGFQPVRREKVVVNIGTDVEVDFKMKVGVTETLTVTAEAPLIEGERTQISSVVDETSIENLPANGRNFIDFVLTTPGVV